MATTEERMKILNMIKENRHKGWDQHYFNSESDAGELKARLRHASYRHVAYNMALGYLHCALKMVSMMVTKL